MTLNNILRSMTYVISDIDLKSSFFYMNSSLFYLILSRLYNTSACSYWVYNGLESTFYVKRSKGQGHKIPLCKILPKPMFFLLGLSTLYYRYTNIMSV